MHKSSLQLALHLLIFITKQSATTLCAKAEYVAAHPRIKCGECPCVSQYCSPQLPPTAPPPPPQLPYLAPPPPRFVYVTELSPPPPSLTAAAGEPGNQQYGSNPYDWQFYSCATPLTHKIEKFVLMVLLFSAFQLL